MANRGRANYWVVANNPAATGIKLTDKTAWLRLHREFYKIRSDEKFFGSTAASLNKEQKKVNIKLFHLYLGDAFHVTDYFSLRSAS
jgi:hypothetical protein